MPLMLRGKNNLIRYKISILKSEPEDYFPCEQANSIHLILPFTKNVIYSYVSIFQ